MLVVFESLVPIFLIILIGQAIKRSGIVADEGWIGMERLSFYVFLPALLFKTLYDADFNQLAAGAATGSFLTGIAIMLAGMLAMRRPIEASFALSPASYSSVYQATTRWNGFIILAIAEKLAGAPGLAIVAIGIGAMVAPINVVNIALVATLGEHEGEKPNPVRQVATNPLIIAVIAGLVMNLAGIRFFEPLDVTLGLITNISLPLGLLMVGAGLRVRLPGRGLAAAFTGTFIKIAVMPAVLGGCAWWFGLRGEALMLVALCGAGPAAMNGYVVARELGGDAPLFAATATLQTAACFFTIPLVVAIAQSL